MASSIGLYTLKLLLLVGQATLTLALACPPVGSYMDLDPQNNLSAPALIDAAIWALGGRQALIDLQGVTYESEDLFRVSSLMQNYNLFEPDRYVVSSGSQNVSFSFHDDGFHQRIDRTLVASDYFFFIRPEISQQKFSLVVNSEAACITEGNNNILQHPEATSGYLDSAMTEYLLFQAIKLSPKLLLEMHCSVATVVTFRETLHPAVHDTRLNLTVIFDIETDLPLLIRSFEDHPISGFKTQDLHLYNYTEVGGILFPQRQKILYGEDAMIEETFVTRIHANPAFEEGFFDGLSENETDTTPSPPEKDPSYGHALLGEYWSNMLWAGPYRGHLGNLSVVHPAADLPGVYHLTFLDTPNVAQLVLEFEDSVIVFESPPQQSDLVIQWVSENLGKPISHLWLSHHHHDHTLDVAKFVEVGASVIVPEMAASYWLQIPGIELVTFTEDQPYIHSDGNMQARFLWRPNTPHSSDWTYAMVTSACPSANSSMLAYVTDSYSTGFEVDSNAANSWLLQAMDDGLSKNATVIPSHGVPVPWSRILEILGSPYPEFDSTSFTRGGEICLETAGK